MSAKQLANLKPIKPGEVRNKKPLGKTPARVIGALTREQIAEVGSILLKGTEEDLETYCEDEGISMLYKFMARVLRKGANRGDTYALEKFFEQVAGHIPKEVKVKLSAHAQLVNMVNDAESEEDDEDDYDLGEEE